MNRNLLLIAGGVCLALASTAQATLVTLDNSTLNGTTLLSAGNANFRGQSFTPSVAGPGAGDTVVANSPLNNPVQLQSISIVGRTSVGGGTTGQIFLDIYLGAAITPVVGDYIGSSTNSLDVDALLDNQFGTFNFASLNLNPGSTYSYYFSTDAVAGSFAIGRVEASDGSPAAGATSSYSGGVAFNSTSNVAFDQRFNATFESVPEPGTFAMMLLGAAFFWVAGRKR